MNITLTPEHECIIQAQIATGKFTSVDEILDHVLAPLKLPSPELNLHEKRVKAQAAAERLRELRKDVTLDRPEGISLREYAHLGHKY